MLCLKLKELPVVTCCIFRGGELRAVNVLNACEGVLIRPDMVLVMADQPDRSPSLRDDNDHSGAHRGPVCPQPGHGSYQGED